MVSNYNYWVKVAKKIISLLITTFILFIIIKLACFYLPFLISFFIAIMLEPIIKRLMKKFKFSRRTSSIVIITFFILVVAIIITCGIIALFNESNNLIKNIDPYVNKVKEISVNFENSKIAEKIPAELRNEIMESKNDTINTATNLIKTTFNKTKDTITKIPNFFIIIFFSIGALFFMCTDKIYMMDQVEHHLPDNWSRKLIIHSKEITDKLTKYLEAEVILIFISFVISLIGFVAFNMVGLKIEFPLLTALGIAFVDALPILGSGTAMIPWAIVEAIKGNIQLGIAIIFLWIVMLITRNFLEPKLVSKHIGVHPVFTIIAMYTGYKLIGVLGLIVGPIFLIILKEVYSPIIDKGIFRSIFEKSD